MAVRREFLPDDHPECTYNHLKSAGFVPEDFGIMVSGQQELLEETREWTRNELVMEIYRLRKELEGIARNGFI